MSLAVLGKTQLAMQAHHNLPRVVTNLGVLDFDCPAKRMQLRSVHLGVTVADVIAATGFELVIPADVPTTPEPTEEQIDVLIRLDPRGLRHREVS